MEKTRDISHTNRNLEDHKALEFALEKDKKKWEGNVLEVKSDPLQDSGTGKPYIIRCFEFKINPEIKYTPTKQELFNAHWKQLQIMLWGDGLRHYEGIEPRIVIGKDTYKIFITAEPRVSNGITQTIAEKPRTLQEILPNASRRP